METNYSISPVGEVPTFPHLSRSSEDCTGDSSLPAAGLRVIVLCAGYRCLGYLDEYGTWRTDARNEEIENVKGWANFE